MEYGCPVCNGLVDLNLNCPRCGEKMKDDGSLDNFLGPYSPYEEHNLLHMMIADEETAHCVHLVSCPKCGEDHRLGVTRVLM